MVRANIKNSKSFVKLIEEYFAKDSYNMEHFKVGDIVYESHFPERIGVITKVSRVAATVQWQSPNPYSVHYLSIIETIRLSYLEKVEGETILNDFDKIATKVKKY